jgi:hypothetical protein
VRNENKAAYLRELFKDHSANLEFVIVGDITAPGAFDEAVKGVSGIIHSASPLSNGEPSVDPNILIQPAVHGNVGILKSGAQNSSTVERVVITSSVTAQLDLTKQLPFAFAEVRSTIQFVNASDRRCIGYLERSRSQGGGGIWKECPEFRKIRRIQDARRARRLAVDQRTKPSIRSCDYPSIFPLGSTYGFRSRW